MAHDGPDPSPAAEHGPAVAENRLATLFHGLSGGPSDLPRDIADVDESRVDLIVVFTARSGSTRFCQQLEWTGLLGYPTEWFNYDETEHEVKRSFGFALDGYIAAIRRLYVTPNGVFGVKLSWPQLRFLQEMTELSHAFAVKKRWVYLRRMNAAAQTVSHYLADASGRFHTQAGDLEDLRRAQARTLYDNDALVGFLHGLISTELAFEEYFADNDIDPLRLYYEDVAADFAGAGSAVAEAIGARTLDSDPTVVRRRRDLRAKYFPRVEEALARRAHPMVRQATDMNRSFELLFRDSNDALLRDLEAARPRLT
jgi:LPS sulfotransferase NodH